MTDATLVQRAVDGDKEAFSLLVERYRHQVYALAFHHVHDFEAAHDLAQEAFVQAYLKLAKLRDADKFIAWLRTLTTNLCRSWLRRAQLDTVSLDDDQAANAHDPRAVPHIAVEQAQQEALVHRSIAALPQRQRLTITMFYMGGLSYQEIAEFLGESVNAIESRLHRARANLQERMIHVIDESFKPHQLPHQFTEEVLEKVQALSFEGGGGQQEPGQAPAVLLEDEKQRRFYIRLTRTEAAAIMTQSTGQPLERPVPQTTLQEILTAFSIAVEQVVLDDVRRGEFWARLKVNCHGQRHIIAARAGDALALAWGLNSSPELWATPKALRKARRQEAVLRNTGAGERGAESVRVEAKADTPSRAASTLPPQEYLYWGTMPPDEEEQKRLLKRQEAEKKRFRRQRPKTWDRTDWKKQVPVRIRSLTSDSESNATMMVLDDSRGRALAIWIGIEEGHSIKEGLGNNQETSNVTIDLPPLPKNSSVAGAHDLIKSLLSACGVDVSWVAIDGNLESVYYSVIALQQDGQLHYIDARPSDSMALAVRYGCPIYVPAKVMKEYSVTHEGETAEAHQVVQLTQHRLRQVRESNAIVREALQTVIDGNIKSSLVTLMPQGDAFHIAVTNRSGKVKWEKVGGLFAQCVTFFYRVTEMDRRKPLPHTGLAHCAFGSPETGFRPYALEVLIKGKAGPVELRLREAEVV